MPHTENNARPNLLFIFADQLGSAYMGCYGHPQVRTPNLDRLAAESAMFEKAYTVCPLCTPFRGTLFTGRYPVQTGIYTNWQRIGDNEKTLANCFNEAGYSTTYVGKWHLSERKHTTWVDHKDRGGFKDFVGWDNGHARHIGQKYFDGDSPEELIMENHESDDLTDIACERLDRRAKEDKPFCMFVAYQAPHPYCNPPEEHLDTYRDKPIAYRPTVDHDTKFSGYGNLDSSETIGVKEWTERYFGEITHLDAAIGRLLEKVGELGLDKNTIIVFTSDHGDMGGCHGRFEKSVPNEEAARIPLFIRHPQITGGLRISAPASSVDFMPTVLGLCNLAPCPTTEGVDYSALILGKDGAPERDTVIMQLTDWSCIVRGDDKLTLDPEGEQAKSFFRLSSDPYEESNLVGNPDESGTIGELTALYRQWLADAKSRA
ncbi:MAG: sulfatase [Planctomycetes bacterium]|nr:sulfatase [Planctomycetota bacterium]